MGNNTLHGKNVLVAVLKNRRDRDILLKKRWYRIPVFYLPKKQFSYIAFYQPAIFGRKGGRIEYFARIAGKRKTERIKLLPQEPCHPRAHDDYLKFEFKEIKKLPGPIRNIIPRRVSFGFTELETLLSARDILELYGVPPIEKIAANGLRRLGIKAAPELNVSAGGRRFRIDLAIFCAMGKIAVECDNAASHSGKLQKSKDRIKDYYLRRAGWRVIRLEERNVIEHLDQCLSRVQKAVETLSG